VRAVLLEAAAALRDLGPVERGLLAVGRLVGDGPDKLAHLPLGVVLVVGVLRFETVEGQVGGADEEVIDRGPAEPERAGLGGVAGDPAVGVDLLAAVHQAAAGQVGDLAVGVGPLLAAVGAIPAPGRFGLGLGRRRLEAEEVAAAGRDPDAAVWTTKIDTRGGAGGVLSPGAALLDGRRAFHVDPLAIAEGPGPGLDLCELVGLVRGAAVLVEAVGLSDHKNPRRETGPAFVAAAAAHKSQRGAVAEGDRLDLAAASARGAAAGELLAQAGRGLDHWQ